MRRAGLLLVTVLFAAGVAVRADYGDDWRHSPKPVRDAVKATVEAQLTAIREGDFARAYGYASEEIRQRFSLAVFTAMLKRGYPMIVRHTQADPAGVRDDGKGSARVEVTVIDRLNRSANYRYYLTREEAGWRIEGVVPEEVPEKGDI